MDKTLIFGLFGHFHTEVNSEMIPNLSRQAAESFNFKTFIFSKNRKTSILKWKILFLDSMQPAETAQTLISQQPAETSWFISGLFFVHN
jgi:hypothetical protein